CWRPGVTWPRCRGCWATTPCPPPCVTPTSANRSCTASAVRWILCWACPTPAETPRVPAQPGYRGHPRSSRPATRVRPDAEPRAAPRHRRPVGVPGPAAGRPDRAVLVLWPARVPVQLVPQPSLPEVPCRLPGRLAGEGGGLPPGRGVSPPGL